MSEFGFDPYIIAQYQQLGNQTSNADLQTLADLATKGTQNRAAQWQLGRQQNLTDIVRGNAGAFSSPYAQSLAQGGYGQEAYEAQNNALMLGQKILGIHRDITASRLSAAQTPEQLNAVMSTMPDDMRQLYGAPAPDATPAQKEAWRKSFITGQLSPEEQAKNREIKETGVPGQMVTFDKSTGTVTPVGGSGTVVISGPELDSAARQFAQTGHMPDVGHDPAGMSHLAILKRAEELFPGQNIAARAATYEADKASLTHLQPQADAVSGFIRTFDKNLKMLEDTTAKLNSADRPGLNKGLRWFQANISGDPALTGFKQALSAVTSEAGKINSGSTGQGSVPISVMQEMEHNLPADATPGQIVEALKVLRKDSENRQDALREQIGAIKGRLGGEQKKTKTESAKPPGSKLDHDAAAVWLRDPANKSNTHYAKALEVYKKAHGGKEP